MAWGRVFKRNGNWYTDIIFQGQRKREKIGPKKDDAQKILNKKLSDAVLEEHGILEDEKITLKEFAEEYLIHKKNSTQASSYVRDEVSVNLHLIPYFGKDYLFNIGPHKIFSYQTKRLSEGVCNSTVNKEVATLKHLLNTAVKWRRIKANPIREIEKLKEPPGRLRYLTLPEINKLLSACPDPPHPLRAIVTIALTTGMRKSEILGLKWEYVRPENRFIILPDTKNNTVGMIPMNDTVISVLDEIPRQSEYVFGKARAKARGDHLEDIKRCFRTACEEAGIKDFRFHDLRHTYGSHLAMRGVHMRALQELMRHKEIKMTMRYSHFSPDRLQDAVKLLDDIIRPAAPMLEEGKTGDNGTMLTPEAEGGKVAASNLSKSLVPLTGQSKAASAILSQKNKD